MLRSASLMNPFGKGVTKHIVQASPFGKPPHHKDAAIDSHMTNHLLENPNPEHVRQHLLTTGVSTLAGLKNYHKLAP